MGCVSGEIAMEPIEANVPITATSLSVTEIKRLTIPPVPFPVFISWYFWCAADVATVSAANPINTKGTAGILPASELASPIASLQMITFSKLGRGNATTPGAGATDALRYAMGMMTEADGLEHMAGTCRIPPGRGGDYVLAGNAGEGASRLWHVVANVSVHKGLLWAVRGR